MSNLKGVSKPITSHFKKLTPAEIEVEKAKDQLDYVQQKALRDIEKEKQKEEEEKNQEIRKEIAERLEMATLADATKNLRLQIVGNS